MTLRRRPRLVLLLPRPFHHQRSIHRIFAAVRPCFEQRYDVEPVVSRYFSKGLVPRLSAVLEARRQRGDIVHVTGDVHYLTLLLPRRRTVLTVHDTEFLLRASAPKRLVYAWVWLRLPVWRSRVVTVPSRATGDDLLRLVPGSAGKVVVVPNPVGDEFKPRSESAPGVSGVSPPVVLLVGTWPNKNLERSAEALAGLSVRAVIVGPLDDRQRAALERAALDYVNRTDLDGEAMVECYRQADMLLFPSTKEGFGMPVVEAQAVGCPVVTSNRAPLCDVAGGAAELVDPFDPISIRAGVQRVLGDSSRRDHLRRAGFENAARYRSRDVAAAYCRIYDEILRCEGVSRRAGGRPR